MSPDLSDNDRYQHRVKRALFALAEDAFTAGCDDPGGEVPNDDLIPMVEYTADELRAALLEWVGAQ